MIEGEDVFKLFLIKRESICLVHAELSIIILLVHGLYAYDENEYMGKIGHFSSFSKQRAELRKCNRVLACSV